MSEYRHVRKKWFKNKYELRARIFGRPIRPWHIALTLSTSVLAISNLFFEGLVLTGVLGDFVGFVALIAVVMLILGWILESDLLGEWGLLVAAGVWTTRAAFAVISTSAWSAMWLSLAWVVGASGTYLLERWDRKGSI